MTAPDTTAIRAQMKALGGGTTDQQYVNEPKKTELVGKIHRVLNPENCSAEFVLAWNRPEAGEVDETDEATARLIAAAPDMRETILALCDALDAERAENERRQTIIGNLHVVEEKHRGTANTHFHRANRLRAENQRLQEALTQARAALAQKGDQP